jgi:hypothetical protein
MLLFEPYFYLANVNFADSRKLKISTYLSGFRISNNFWLLKKPIQPSPTIETLAKAMFLLVWLTKTLPSVFGKTYFPYPSREFSPFMPKVKIRSWKQLID